MLDIENKNCLVIGGGNVALRKIKALLSYGADVSVTSRELCSELQKQDWCISNIDCTILAEKPQMAPHISSMKQNLAQALAVSPDLINIKATRGEGLGFIGRAEGIGAVAIATLFTRS